MPLNESNQDLQVNWLQYGEYGPDGEERTWTWVTDLEISRQNARWLVKGGRCRWKIENETFNTLKNQGYHFEHNYGHGEKNLSVVFAMLMMLAFLVDQVQQLCCPLFQAVGRKWEASGRCGRICGLTSGTSVFSRCGTFTRSCSMIWPRNSPHRH